MRERTESDAPGPAAGIAILAALCLLLGLAFLPAAIVGAVLGIVALRRARARGASPIRLVAGTAAVVLPCAAIVAAIALPGLIESRSVANEHAAATALAMGVLPAQRAFRAAAHRDPDGDGVGEYGTFADLAGSTSQGGPARALALLPAVWNAQRPAVSGYRFALHVDGGRGFVAYAWPQSPHDGARRFAVTADGVVHWERSVQPDHEPGEFALWGGTPAPGYAGTPAAAWRPWRR